MKDQDQHTSYFGSLIAVSYSCGERRAKASCGALHEHLSDSDANHAATSNCDLHVLHHQLTQNGLHLAWSATHFIRRNYFCLGWPS